ncbi:putative Ig domain-containing protein [Sphingomonas sp. M1-B02]|uniref:putative Ig domain-containing protein n=1 Tax=Sphingomonas sp. M1-B02 TaxID=3114300 RepID=UPI002240CD2E|nr:putative Ig domain-containing protein [Sphingomonas sp. S6-11]UZK66222.1 putative Ig domain-containing protein [Sphingomonas sp. S6-11]
MVAGSSDVVIVDTQTNLSVLNSKCPPNSPSLENDSITFEIPPVYATTVADNIYVTFPNGSKVKLTSNGIYRRIVYTPGPGVIGTDIVSPRSGASGTRANAAAFSGETVQFEQQWTSGGVFKYFDIHVTVIAPSAPTAALGTPNPSTIYAGGTSTVTVTLTNPNSTAGLSGVGNSITLPTGVAVAASPGASNTCGGTVTAAPGATGAGAVTLSGGSLAAGGTCTMTFNITSSTVATHSISSGTPSATGANAGSPGTSANLTVQTPPSPPTIAAAWDQATVAVGGAGTLSVTLTNPNSGVALTGVGFNIGTLPIGLTGGAVGGTCAGGSYNGGTRALSSSGHSLAASGTCTVTLAVTGATAGSYSFTTGTAVATGPVALTGATATTGTLNVVGAPTISAAFSPTSVAINADSTLTLTLTNPNAVALSGVAVAPTTLPAGLTGSTPATNCGGAASFGGGGLGLTGGGIAAGGSCTLTLTVASATPATYNFTSGAPSATGPAAVTGIAASTPTGLSVVQAAPTISGITPVVGTTLGGTSVTISGTGFSNISGVTFGGTAATGVTPNGTTQITAVSPAHAAGTFDVVVTTAGGPSANSAADDFRYVAPPAAPVVTSPTNAARVGSASSVYAGSADPGMTITVLVDGSSIGTTTATGGAWTFAQPVALAEGSHTVRARATNGDGIVSADSTTISFIVDTVAPPAPVITAPVTGTRTNDNTLNFTGTAEADSTVRVYIDGAFSGTASLTGTNWTYAAPLLADATYSFWATATDLTGNLGPQSTAGSITIDTVLPAVPVIATPTEGQTTSPTPNISGTAEANASVTLTIDATPVVVPADSGGNWSHTPAALPLGAHSVTAFARDAANNLGPTTATRNFTVAAIPSVTGLAPASGPVAGTNAVTLTGTGFTGATAVSFGASPASYTVNSDLSITATAPPGSGTVNVRVTNPAGTSSTAVANQYSYVAAPALTGFAAAAVAYGSTGNPIDAAAGSGATNVPTAWGVAKTAGGPFAAASQSTAGGVNNVQINPAGQVIYDAPAGFRGSDSFYIRATNVGGDSNVVAVTVLVNNPTLATTLAGTGTRDVVLAGVQLNSSGGAGSYSCNPVLASGALPAGTALQPDCTITGTPTASGTFNFTASVTDQSTGTGPFTQASGPLALVIAAPTLGISPVAGALPAATAGTAYSQAITATGGTAPYTLSVTAGALPAGLSIAGGTLSGAPTASGNFSFTITATDSSTAGSGGPYTVSAAYTLAVAAPTLTLTPAAGALPGATAGVAYAQSVSASGGITPYGYAVTGGALPAGIALDGGSGALTGTATATGTFNFTITATDATSGTPASVAHAYSLTVAAPVLAITTATPLPAGKVSSAYSRTLAGSGGTTPYAFSLAAGALPPGIGLSTGGLLSGTPTTAGDYAFTVRLTDSSGGGPHFVDKAFALHIDPPVTISPGVVPAAVIGAAYSQTLVGVDGTAPYAFTISAGALPAGITLSSGGILAGTATQGGTFSFTVQATDAAAIVVTQAYSLTVNAPGMTIAPTALNVAQIGVAYSQATSASGGTAPYAYSITAGALPAGILLDATSGALTGTPTAGGAFNFTVTAIDSSTGTGPYTVGRAYTLTVNPPAIAVAPVSLGGGSVGSAYAAAITASGGTGAYSFALTAGALPPGITIAPGGALSGTPTADGSFAFTVTATDSSTGTGPFTGSRSYSITIAPLSISVSPPVLAPATAGVAYSQQLGASGGVGGYSFALAAGSLPAGLSLTGDTISGTPSAPGSFAFTIRATDSSVGGSAPYSGLLSYTLVVSPGAIVVAPATLAPATVGMAYAQTVTASGGTGGFSFTLASGSLPPGLTLATGGALSGTPIAGGSYGFTIAARDGSGAVGSQAYTLVVAAPALALSAPPLPAGSVGLAYSGSVAASGGTAPYSYAISAGALPAGMALATDGTLSGTPTAAGSFALTITATDNSGGSGPYTVSRAYTLDIAGAAVSVTPPTLPAGQAETAYTATLGATGGVAPYRFAVSAGALPAGLSLAANGTLAGTPAAQGSYSFTVTATDSATGSGPFSGSQAYTLTIGTPPIPVAGPANITVAFGSTSNPVALPLSGAAATAVAIATAPQHGTATASGTAIVYTPAPGYYGADSFTYTATNAGGTSPPATIGVTVSLPPAPTAADRNGVAVAYASAGTPIDLAPSVSGVSSALTIATAPAHGTAALAGSVVTYVPAPTYFGTDSFTFTATGPGGTSAPATVRLTVATPAAPVAADRSGIAIPYESGGTAIDLAASISGVHTAIAVASAPVHGTTSVTGNVVTYVPALDFAGADSFTYVATGPGGTSNVATVTVSVTAPPPPSVSSGGANVPAATGGKVTSIDVDLSALAGGEYTSLQISKPPANGTVTLSNGGSTGGAGARSLRTLAVTPIVATYRPNPGFTGSDSFQFIAVGPGGSSAPATISITVLPDRPVALPKSASVGDGQTVSVDLTAGASGAPFTAATIVSVAPANAVKTALVESGAGASRAYRLDVTALARFGGTVLVTYTISNQSGASNPATITVTVTARPDPAADPNVRGIVDAQVETARRFARSQVSNFMARAEQLHGSGGGNGGAEMGVRLASRDGRGVVRASPAFDASALEITERMRLSGEDPELGRYANRRGPERLRADELGSSLRGGAPAIARNRRSADAPPPGSSEDDDGTGGRRIGSIALWSSGAIDIGTLDATTDRTKITATTSGLSAGADIKLAEGVTLGVGGGYGNDVSHIGGGAARVRGENSLVAAYASIVPAESLFLDGMIGRSDLSFRTRRSVAGVNAVASGNRDGSFTLGALAAGIERESGPLSWSLYGRGELLDGELGAYTESGAGRFDLRFDERRLRSVTGSLGARFEYRQKFAWGSAAPRIRAEWNYEFADTGVQRLDYADIAGPAFYSVDSNGWKREQYMVSLGARFLLPAAWTFDIETALRGASGERAGTLRLTVSSEF